MKLRGRFQRTVIQDVCHLYLRREGIGIRSLAKKGGASHQKLESVHLNLQCLRYPETDMCEIAGRVIVDPEASAKASKNRNDDRNVHSQYVRYRTFKPESYDTEGLDSQYLRCSALIEVFSLVDHVWYRVPVLNLTEPQWKQDPWDQLELSMQRKTLLRTLVNTHTNQHKRSGDLIDKKGKGLVFLFPRPAGLGQDN